MGKSRITIGLICCLWWSACAVLAQPDPFVLKSRAHYGFIIPHRDGMKHLIKGHVPAFELSLQKHTYGDLPWERLYNCPDIGISVFYDYLANPEQLGNSIGIYPFVDFPLYRGDRLRLLYKVGVGTAYLTRHWSRTENYKNTVIGSHFNCFITMQGEAEWRIAPSLFLSSGIAFNHMSNGALKVPNLGVNLPTVHAAIGYQIGRTDKTCRTDSIPDKPSKPHIRVFAGGGIKDNMSPTGELYPVYTASAEVSKHISRKSLLALGPDFFYSTSLVARVKDDTSRTAKASDGFQAGISLAYMAEIGRLYLIVGKGVYFINPADLDGSIYHRIAVRYAISERWIAQARLNTHWFKADFIEWGLGIKLY